MTILVDHRERGCHVQPALERLGALVVEETLPLADYMLAARVGAERKTIADLHRSIQDRRLWSQVAGLRADLDRAYLVVEGANLDTGPISRAGVRGALLAVADLGILVIRASGPTDTALWLWRIALRHGTRNPRRVVRSLPHGRRPTAEAVLATIPGISPDAASRLLGRFGSVAGVANASRDDLLAVAGVGAARADALQRFLTNTGT